MLRQRFLKSFEEKIKEIEAARVQELEILKQEHEAAVRSLTSLISSASQRLRLLVGNAGVKGMDEFIGKSLLTSREKPN